jgi:uncharacterized protein YqgC (DUF456 family)
MLNILAALILAVVVVASWFMQLLGLPGNWLIVAAAFGYAWLFPSDSVWAIGRETVIALVLLALLGEAVEFVAGAAGVAKVGGSRRSAVLALLGSLIGGVLGAVIGLPIPVVGSLVAAVVFGSTGAMVGAFLGESWKGRDFDMSLAVGKAAFVGRVLGTLAKMIVASIMIAVTLAALVLP